MEPPPVPLRVYRYALAVGDAPLADLLAGRLFHSRHLADTAPAEAAVRAVEAVARHLGLRLPAH